MPVIELGTTVDIHVLFRNSLVVGDGLLFVLSRLLLYLHTHSGCCALAAVWFRIITPTCTIRDNFTTL